MTQNNEQPFEDINILKLLASIISFLSTYFKTIIFFILLGLAVGVYIHYVAKKKFKTTFIGASDVLRNEYVILLVDNLNQLLYLKEYEIVSSLLNIKLDESKKLLSITATPVDIKELRNSTTNEKLSNTFKIELESSSNDIFANVQNGIIYYLKNNEFVKKRIQLQAVYLDSTIAAIDKEILKLDSLRNTIYKTNVAKSSYTIISDITDLNKLSIELKEKKINLLNSKQLLNEVFVIQSFIKVNTPYSTNLILDLLTGIIGGGIVGLIFSIGLLLNKKLKEIS